MAPVGEFDISPKTLTARLTGCRIQLSCSAQRRVPLSAMALLLLGLAQTGDDDEMWPPTVGGIAIAAFFILSELNPVRSRG